MSANSVPGSLIWEQCCLARELLLAEEMWAKSIQLTTWLNEFLICHLQHVFVFIYLSFILFTPCRPTQWSGEKILFSRQNNSRLLTSRISGDKNADYPGYQYREHNAITEKSNFTANKMVSKNKNLKKMTLNVEKKSCSCRMLLSAWQEVCDGLLYWKKKMDDEIGRVIIVQTSWQQTNY